MTAPRVELDGFHTVLGRVFLLSLACVAALFVVQRLTTPPLPTILEIFRKVVSFVALVTGVWTLVAGLVRNRRKLLWRVRRRLILTYVLLGVIPVALVAAFALSGGVVLYTNVANYLFHEGFQQVVEQMNQAALTGANDISQDPGSAALVLARKYRNLGNAYPGLSLALVPDDRTRPAIVVGPWRHMPVPVSVPAWAKTRPFKGILAIGTTDAEDCRLLVRASAPLADGSATLIVDLPVDTDVAARLDDDTGTRIGGVSITNILDTAAPTGGVVTPGTLDPPDQAASRLFRDTSVSLDIVDWNSGATGGQAKIRLDAPVGALYRRLSSVQSAPMTSSLGARNGLLIMLLVLGVLFLIIQGSALFIGVFFARSITHAVHELFVGTERVQQGDFAHRIPIASRDQLGDLAGSFNRMSASIGQLLIVQGEKQRLDDELRIAREIQKSLLPSGVPHVEGLSIAALCEPAREVGGDYYDFFDLGPRQLGVLIADVAGKGTSAALYMAELKGLMLSLSRTHRSPRRLLIEVNELLAGHLDNRSFITMTYAVIDLDAGTLTSARAGHTPLVVVNCGVSEVVMSSGMVVGLRIPGVHERFESLLEEHSRPICQGDVIIFYTDGVTEAMNVTGDLFGETALADVVTANDGLDAPDIRECILRDVKLFVGDA